ncbi:MAG: bifunctional serine/threonine-protein kinase/formylglycine-generating enzyme family protein [Bacteroidales bacterium]|nr:bifunctional serine/threonine-protein kinase/formylglycine-generating enzyme family protein [Bacteroidales bacterium]MDY2704467.1 bifunctional serine/threonine-protein kinase/formylglycine-generating enzyme family protein [Alloprevotella sp.]
MSTLQPGSTLQNGKYEIQRVLGQGGFGVTYLALQQGLNRIVAIKEFFMENFCVRNADTHHVTIATESSRELVERYRNKFLKEARNIAKLEHPNIVSIIDVFEENSTAYYVMKYAQNGSLDDKIKREGHLSEADAKRYILKIANALRFVHQHKMTHLDVKPANILLSDNDEPWLIDFGLSKQYDAKTGEQTSSTPLGYSPGYAPIEQYMAGGAGTFSPESDIYSLGATFYKLLTGDTPPDASTVANEGLPVQELKAKGVSQQTIYAIFQAMEPLRKDRLHDMDSFINLLEKELEQEPSEQPATQQLSQPYTVQTIIREGTAPAAVEQHKEQAEAQPQPQPKQSHTPVLEEKRTNWTGLGVALTVIVVIVVIVATVFILNNHSQGGGSDINADTSFISADTSVNEAWKNEAITFEANGVSFTMIPVESGTFTMGATSEMENPDDNEKPTHQVTLSSFYIGETEVTQALWKAVMDSNPSGLEGDDLPVEYVSWNDCQTFISKLNALTGKNFRLPTEAEWEFAARGGNQSRHTQYSGSSRIDDVAWYNGIGNKTHPVKTKQPNELGIYDMTGNADEWCQDWYGDYSSYAQTNPTGAGSGSKRVVRGGCWLDSPRYCHSSIRFSYSPENSIGGRGLRLVFSQ